MAQIKSTSERNDNLLQADLFMKTIRQTHADVNAKFKQMNQLKTDFFDSQQEKFIGMFVKIMNKLSNDLKRAVDDCNHIDKEIETHPRCNEIRLKQQSFQLQCLHLKKELATKKELLKGENIRHRKLLMERYQLERKLYSSTSKEIKYREKTRSLMAKELSDSGRQSFELGQKRMQNSARGNEKMEKIATDINFHYRKNSHSVTAYLKTPAFTKTQGRSGSLKITARNRTMQQRRSSELFKKSPLDY